MSLPRDMSCKRAAEDDAHPRADKCHKPSEEKAETEQKATLCPHCELADARPEEICNVCDRAVCSYFCGLTTKTICNVRKCRVRVMCFEPQPNICTLIAGDADRCGDCDLAYCVKHRGDGAYCKGCETYLCRAFLDVHVKGLDPPYCLGCKPYDMTRAYSPVAPAGPVDPSASAVDNEDGGEPDVPPALGTRLTLESVRKSCWVGADEAVAALHRSVDAMELAATAVVTSE